MTSDVMTPDEETVASRRDILYISTAVFALAGVGRGVVWPLIDSLNPSADVLAATGNVEVDVSTIEAGERITVKWRSKPVFITRRTPEEIAAARQVSPGELKDPEADRGRVERPEWLVVIGICTHLGCIPLGQKPSDNRGEWDGWFCPCHGSHYDTSGRIRKGPAPRNLDVPPYRFLSGLVVEIGPPATG